MAPGVDFDLNEGGGGTVPPPGIDFESSRDGVEIVVNKGGGGAYPPPGVEFGVIEGGGGVVPAPSVEFGVDASISRLT